MKQQAAVGVFMKNGQKGIFVLLICFSREGGIACAPPGEVNFAIVLWADGGNVGDIIAAIRSVPLEID